MGNVSAVTTAKSKPSARAIWYVVKLDFIKTGGSIQKIALRLEDLVVMEETRPVSRSSFQMKSANWICIRKSFSRIFIICLANPAVFDPNEYPDADFCLNCFSGPTSNETTSCTGQFLANNDYSARACIFFGGICCDDEPNIGVLSLLLIRHPTRF